MSQDEILMSTRSSPEVVSISDDIPDRTSKIPIVDDGPDSTRSAIDKETEDNYRIWKKNTPFLYDYLSTNSLLWPSLSVQWFPDSETTTQNNVSNSRLLLGTYTSGQSQDYIDVIQMPLNQTIVENINLNKFDLEKKEFINYDNSFPKLNRLQRINHDCDVNKARYCPQKPDLIATINSFGSVSIYDRTKHPSNPSASLNKPDIQLNRHTNEGFGLAWNYQNEGQLLSCAMDGSIIYWDIRKRYTKNNTSIEPESQITDTASSGFNDVKWIEKHDSVCGAVSESGSVSIYDTRNFVLGKAAYHKPGAHDNPINSISFNSAHLFCFATGDSSGHIKVWDMRNLSLPYTDISAHQDVITSLEWNPKYSSVLASSSMDKTVSLWDISQPVKKLFTHGGHMLSVNDVSWNPQSDWMLSSVGDDNSLHIWRPSASIVDTNINTNGR